MPRIKSLLNGEVSNVRGDIAREMIKLGVAEAIDNVDAPESAGPRLPKYNPANVPQPTWSVSIEGNVRKELAIRMELPGLVALYSGDPKYINSRVSWPGGSRFINGFGRECPAEIAAQYARQWKDNEQLRAFWGFANDEERQAFSSKVNENQAAEKKGWV